MIKKRKATNKKEDASMELLCLDIINSNHFGGYLGKAGQDMLENEDWLRALVDK